MSAASVHELMRRGGATQITFEEEVEQMVEEGAIKKRILQAEGLASPGSDMNGQMPSGGQNDAGSQAATLRTTETAGHMHNYAPGAGRTELAADAQSGTMHDHPIGSDGQIGPGGIDGHVHAPDPAARGSESKSGADSDDDEDDDE